MNAILNEVRDETAAMLGARAREQGLPVDEYLRSLLNPTDPRVESREVGPTETDEILDELAAGGENLRPLPADFSRQDIYGDHD